MARDLPAPPRSESYSAAELVSDALRGRLRIPPFQRGLRWDSKDVALLFDSLNRGYPVGSLLLWRGGPPAPEGPVQLGPVVIAHSDGTEVRWVVDGQQRLVSLVASLTRLGSRDATFDLWFDSDENGFHPRPRRGPDPQWVEVWRLLDAADLGEFLLTWTAGTPERRRSVLEAGRRIREYRVPCTVFETSDDAAVRHVFQRLNFQGKALNMSEIFDAWAAPGGTLVELSAAGAQLGWGAIDEAVLLGAVLVNEGRDPTRKLTPEDSVDTLARGADRLRPGLVRCVQFLRDRAAIPHYRLLPYNYPLQVLPAFFVRHPEPSARTRTLLTRWVWRMLAGTRPGDPALLRAAARAMQDQRLSEDDRVQRLLAATPREIMKNLALDQRFRSDSGSARIALVALATLQPVDLRTGLPLDIRAHFEAFDPIVAIVTGKNMAGTLGERIANRTFQPPGVKVEDELDAWIQDAGVINDALLSHAIDPEGAEALRDGDIGEFLIRRDRSIRTLIVDHLRRFTAVDQDDRPNLREALAP